VIEVRGTDILISESLDDATTKRVVADFWPAAGSPAAELKGKQASPAPPAKP
jgi:hypothetical protein